MIPINERDKVMITESIYYLKEGSKEYNFRRSSHSKSPTKLLNKYEALQNRHPQSFNKTPDLPRHTALANHNNKVYCDYSPIKRETPINKLTPEHPVLQSPNIRLGMSRNKSNLLQPKFKPTVPPLFNCAPRNSRTPVKGIGQKANIAMYDRSKKSVISPSALVNHTTNTCSAPFIPPFRHNIPGDENVRQGSHVKALQIQTEPKYRSILATIDPNLEKVVEVKNPPAIPLGSDNLYYSKIVPNSPSFSNILDEFKCADNSGNCLNSKDFASPKMANVVSVPKIHENSSKDHSATDQLQHKPEFGGRGSVPKIGVVGSVNIERKDHGMKLEDIYKGCFKIQKSLSQIY